MAIGVTLAAIALSLACVYRNNVTYRIERGDFASAPDLLRATERSDDAVQATGLILLVALICGLALLIAWLYRSAKNNDLWSESAAQWAPGWTIGGWFIPLANLVVPPLVFHDVWRRSFGRRPLWDGGASKAPAIALWWLVWLGGAIVLRVDPGGSDLNAVRTIDWTLIGGAGAVAISWALLIWFIACINDEQAQSLNLELALIDAGVTDL